MWVGLRTLAELGTLRSSLASQPYFSLFPVGGATECMHIHINSEPLNPHPQHLGALAFGAKQLILCPYSYIQGTNKIDVHIE